MTIVDPMQPLKSRNEPFKHRPAPKMQVASITVPAPPPTPVKRSRSKPATKKQTVKPANTTRRWPKIVIIVLLVVSFMILPELISQILIVAYGILAVFRRFVVGLTFGLAILVLLLSPLFTLVTGSSGNGAILASYSFGLLLVGFIQLIVEYRRMQHK